MTSRAYNTKMYIKENVDEPVGFTDFLGEVRSALASALGRMAWHLGLELGQNNVALSEYGHVSSESVLMNWGLEESRLVLELWKYHK
jgi:hypothetical protein